MQGKGRIKELDPHEQFAKIGSNPLVTATWITPFNPRHPEVAKITTFRKSS